jgi:hypothetical protein
MGVFKNSFSASATEFSGGITVNAPPSTVPAGFDSIIQLNTRLINVALASNLATWNLNPLSARVPYQADQVSPKLRALIQPLLGSHASLLQGPPQLEVQILAPAAQSLNWPVSQIQGVSGGGSTSALSRRARTARQKTVVLGRQKTVDFAWAVQVNLFRPASALANVTAIETAGLSNSGPSSAGTVRGGLLSNTGTFGTGSVNVAPPLPQGSRTTVASGSAATRVPCDTVVNSQLFQFQLVANFGGVQAAYSSDDAAMAQFLQTDLARSLLAQALAPLLNQYAIGLSPTFAIAGGLTPTQVVESQLPTLRVNDLVLKDPNGQLVAFCVSLGTDSEGTLDAVISFLAGQDFAYYASDRVYGPVLKGLWAANAIYTPAISNVSVEMPVSPGSSETGAGVARVQVVLGNSLTDAVLVASTQGDVGDPMRIDSTMTVTLLGLWDPRGNQITDLGPLGDPTVEPFALSLQLFDKPVDSGHLIHPPLSNTIAAMFSPLYFPMIERYGVTSVSGYTSSPLHILLARWSLPRLSVVGTNTNNGVMANV